MNKLLVYIVSYERKSYTQGTIELISQSLPPNSQIIVCDNGSTDGTREWLKENQEKYNLGLIFPDKNLRVGGAWTLLTSYFEEDEFDYVLLLDNDGWVLPSEKDWFEVCMKLFDSDPTIGSLGLQKEREQGYFSMGKNADPNFQNKKSFENQEYYDTVFYAAFRLDKFKLWHQTMKDWPHLFIGDKLGRHYNSLGFRTIKITPGYIVDVSEYNFNNKSHEEYNVNFYKRERDTVEFERRLNLHSTQEKDKEFIINNFGEKYLKYLD